MKDDSTASLNRLSEWRDWTKKFYSFAC